MQCSGVRMVNLGMYCWYIEKRYVLQVAKKNIVTSKLAMTLLYICSWCTRMHIVTVVHTHIHIYWYINLPVDRLGSLLLAQ